MGKIQWERDIVEQPFCRQLETMGWSWLEGDVDVPELTESPWPGDINVPVF
jgi:type I restriction enzyme R subunit